MQKPETRDELLNKLGEPRRLLVDALRFYGGEANSRELREHTDISRGSVQHHLSILQDWDVIKERGTEYAGRGPEATVYQLTNRGESIIGAVRQNPITADGFHDLEARVDDLEEDVDRLLDVYTDIRATIEQVRDDLQNIKKPQ
jgi:DNA-binding transcriptional ArsR family regulator